VISIATFAGTADQEALRLAATLEQASEHPLAAALVDAARTRSLTLARVDRFEAIAGKGIRGWVDGVPVLAGSDALLIDEGVPVDEARDRADDLRRQGQTVVHVAANRRLVALIGIADPIKPSTPEAIELLRGEGLRLVMLTGDNPLTAAAVAARLGITDVRAGVLPDAKRDVIAALEAAGHVTAMAGDGINDAPALAAATVGIAMGSGTDVAMESAGITLVKGDLRGIVRARRLSRATMKNIRQNLWLAFVYNAIGVPVAAGILYPVTGTLISPIWASAAMTLSSVSVIGNALRLHRARL
jgi:Cu+-exporting ATPase